MPRYLVELTTGISSRRRVASMVVVAQDVPDARAMAKYKQTGNAASNAAWDAATVTELTEGDLTVAGSMQDWRVRATIFDSDPVVDVESLNPSNGVVAAVINAAGTGYSVNDVLSVAGGTATRVATVRVTAETGGAIDSVEVIDPGEYTVDPTTTANPVTGGGGSSATVDLTLDNASFGNHLANVVTRLNDVAAVHNVPTQIVQGASIDMGGANITLVLALGSGTDDLGDKDANVVVYPPRLLGGGGEQISDDVGIPSFVTAITDEGVATDNLSATMGALSRSVPAIFAEYAERR